MKRILLIALLLTGCKPRVLHFEKVPEAQVTPGYKNISIPVNQWSWSAEMILVTNENHRFSIVVFNGRVAMCEVTEASRVK